MDILERAIAAISPRWAYKRLQYRESVQNYEAVRRTRLHKQKRETRSGTGATRQAAKPLRETARYMDQSNDFAVGVLNTFVANVIGPKGIQVEPQPRTMDGEIATEFADQILYHYNDFSCCPDVRREFDLAGMERMAGLTWARDGEAFGQHLAGNVPGLEHGSQVPYSIRMMEPDLIPLDKNDPQLRLQQGIYTDQWGRKTGYEVLLNHPGDAVLGGGRDTQRIPAAQMMHLKQSRRIGQLRGVSLLAPVMLRVDDVAEYEQSERTAARVAAAMTVAVKKTSPDYYSGDGTDDETDSRLLNIAPGMIWDNLRPGEDVEVIQSSRPSALLMPFRDAMLKMVAAGTGTGSSSISKNYNGTYAAQRQELVEQFVIYSSNTAHFINSWSRPTYQTAVATMIAARLVEIPANIDPLSLDDAAYYGPVMPWIDPAKEAMANLIQVQAGFKSRAQVIRERGGNPMHTTNEIYRERLADSDRGITFSSDFANEAKNILTEIEERESQEAA